MGSVIFQMLLKQMNLFTNILNEEFFATIPCKNMKYAHLKKADLVSFLNLISSQLCNIR